MPDLLDSISCGEDLVANAERVLAIAPTACIGCDGYHVRTVLQRCAGIAKGISVDRQILIPAIAGAARASTQNPVRVLIAGAADTGILATAAHAAAIAGIACRFIVADRCETPLALCRRFGEDHGLDVSTQRSNIEDLILAEPADLIVVHSLLRFIAPRDQVVALRRLGEALAPEGNILLSMRLKDGTAGEAAEEARKHQLSSAAVRQLLANGTIQSRQSIDDIMALTDRAAAGDRDRPGETNSPEDLQERAKEAGLTVASSSENHWRVGVGQGSDMARRRALVILEKCRR